LTLIICGTGLLKPNVSTMVGQLYRGDPDESRRDSAFSIFYMGINIGAWLAPYVTSTLGQNVNWHLGFAAAAVGMAIGLVQYVLGARKLGDAGRRPADPATPAQLKRFYAMVGLTVAALGALVALGVATDTFNAGNVANVLAAAAVLVTVGYFGYLFRPSHGLTQEERSHLTAYVWLFIAAAIFWMIYDQAANTLTFFAANSVDLNVLGWEMPSGWTQSFNPAMLLALSPLFAVLWLGPLHRMSTPTKFAIGVVLVGMSFVVMSPLAAHTSTGAKISVWWLAFVYLIQTVGELFLSPVGLAITTKLAPAKFASQMMGVWFLAVAVGDAIGGQATRLNGTVLSESMYFLVFGLFAAAAGVALFMFVGKLRTLMGEDADVDLIKN
jgi:POT family proton-dependent oligopeptide transporter